MRFGICTSLDQAPAMEAAGWDYVEGNIQSILQGALPDAEWNGAEQVKQSLLPVPVGYLLVPATLKITGADVDLKKLRAYMITVVARAAKVGMRVLVFGSGKARHVPDGFDREDAKRQIAQFARMCAEIAAQHDVTVVVEPLNRAESNIINSVEEAMTYVKAVDHPNFKCLVDTYHLWLENEPLKHVAEAAPFIRHMHVADKAGRVPPGRSGTSDYRPLFSVLKGSGYDGKISVEGNFPPELIREQGATILNYLKTQWLEA